MAAKFEIQQPKPGEFKWVLTSQGRVLAESETYTRKISCQNALESFRRAAPTATVVDHTAMLAKAPATATAKVARTTGRVVGKAAAKVAEVPEAAVDVVKKVVETVLPTPRKRTAKTS